MANADIEADLANDEDYEDLVEDMREECGKHGAIESVNIPRTGDGRGKIFIVYAQVESSMRAQASLNGRKFGGQPVSASFLAEEKYRLGIFSD